METWKHGRMWACCNLLATMPSPFPHNIFQAEWEAGAATGNPLANYKLINWRFHEVLGKLINPSLLKCLNKIHATCTEEELIVTVNIAKVSYSTCSHLLNIDIINLSKNILPLWADRPSHITCRESFQSSYKRFKIFIKLREELHGVTLVEQINLFLNMILQKWSLITKIIPL